MSIFIPEILFISFLILTPLNYNLMASDSFNFSTLLYTVPINLCLLVLVILSYTLRPNYGPFLLKTRYDSSWQFPFWGFFLIATLLTATMALPSLLILKNAHSSSIFMIVCGSGWAVSAVILILVVHKGKGAQKNILAPVKFWNLSIVFLLLLAILTVPLAEYNPALKHASYHIIPVKLTGTMERYRGHKCRADIGVYTPKKGKKKCRARFFCGGDRLYGQFGKGVFPCRARFDDNELFIKGRDISVKDGDPAFSINTMKDRVFYSQKHSLKRKKELIGTIIRQP